MKKITAVIFALILTLGLVGCNGKKVNIDFPFEVEDVESVEMYHYNGAPASAEKKVVVAESDIKTLYDMFKGLSLKDKTAEETAGADVTSFRFNLSDGTSYDLIYACYGAKNGNLKSELSSQRKSVVYISAPKLYLCFLFLSLVRYSYFCSIFFWCM